MVFTSDYAQVAAVDPKPVAPAGSGFANLVDMTRFDNIGVGAITPIDADGVTDPNGRTLVYSATGLPVSSSVFAPGLTINSATGQITGTYDANGTEVFTVTVTVTPTGSTKSLTKTFQLTVFDQG